MDGKSGDGLVNRGILPEPQTGPIYCEMGSSKNPALGIKRQTAESPREIEHKVDFFDRAVLAGRLAASENKRRDHCKYGIAQCLFEF
jgi:hypothetical protein